MNTGISSSLIYSGLPFTSMPGLAPAGDLLFFASPKKPKEKKGDPQSGPLRGSLKKLKEPENLETSQLRCRRTSRFFNPSPSAFSSPARTGLGRKAGTNFPESESISPTRPGWAEERRRQRK